MYISVIVSVIFLEGYSFCADDLKIGSGNSNNITVSSGSWKGIDIQKLPLSPFVKVPAVTVNGNLSLTGPGYGKSIITAHNPDYSNFASQIYINSGSSLNFAGGGADTGGILQGQVRFLSSSASLSVMGGEYGITGTVQGNGLIKVTDGGTLVVSKAGTSSPTAFIGRIILDRGNLVSIDAEYDAMLEMGNGSTLAAESINLEGKTSFGPGISSILAKNDIIIKSSPAAREDSIVNLAAGGNIAAVGIDLNAQEIRAGNSVIASSVAAKKLDALSIDIAGSTVINNSLELNGLIESRTGSLTLNNAQAAIGNLKIADNFLLNGGQAAAQKLTAGNVLVGNESFSSSFSVARPDIMLLGVGKNGYVSLGCSDPDWLSDHIKNFVGINSALGISSPFALKEGGGILADPSAPHPLAASGVFAAKADSLTVVTGNIASENSQGAISSAVPASAEIASGAKLMVVSAFPNRIYRIFGDNLSVNYASDDAFGNGNLMTNSHLIELKKVPGKPGYFYTEQIPSQQAYPPLDGEIGGVLDGHLKGDIIGVQESHFNSPYPGIRFLSRASSVTYMGRDHDLSMTTMEGAARAALVAAVPQMALAASSIQGSAARKRYAKRFSAKRQPGEDRASGASAWAAPFVRADSGFDLHANNYDFDYSALSEGISAGIDWSFTDSAILGADMIAGAGKSASGGDLPETENRMKFAGAGFYGAYFLDNFNFGFDLHYLYTWNDIRQRLPARLEMADLTGELTARLFSAAAEVEYLADYREWDFIPHAGVRYIYLHTDPYVIYSGGALLEGRAVDQGIWQFPAGVALKRNFATEKGWVFAPFLDFAAVPSAGDIEAKTRTRFTGTRRDAVLHTQSMDFFAVKTVAGLNVSSGNFKCDFSFALENGAHGCAQSFSANFSYEF